MDTAGIIFAVLASITWGMVYVIDQKVLTSMSPILLLAFGSIIISIIMLPAIFLNREEVRVVLHSGKNNLLLILFSQVLIATATFFILSSIKHLGASTASILEITYPFFVAVFSLLVFGGNVNIYFWLGSALIFIGSAILVKLS